MQSITIIGNGNMAFAIAKGLTGKYHIEVVGRSEKSLDEFEKRLGFSVEKSMIDGFDVTKKSLILCVKPANLSDISRLTTGKADLLISILAGVSLKKLKKELKSKKYLRAMPNIAARVNNSFTSLIGDSSGIKEAKIIFDSIGRTLCVNSEKELDIATALAGSGPAYLALVAEALCDGAVKEGLKREYALQAVRGLFGGFAELLLNEETPSKIKDAVMSPAGTTAAGYAELESAGVRDGCIRAISAAHAKAKELT